MADENNNENGETPNDDGTNEQNGNEQSTPPSENETPESGSNEREHDGSNEEGNETPATDDVSRETFDRDYVEKLRSESKNYRTRLREAEALAQVRGQELLAARVDALGLMADPSDLTYSDELAGADADTLREHVEELLAEKPHLRAVAVPGGVPGRSGQGEDVSLVSLLRSGA